MANFSAYLKLTEGNRVLMAPRTSQYLLGQGLRFEHGDLNFHETFRTDNPDDLEDVILMALRTSTDVLQVNSWDLIIIEFDENPHNPKNIWKISREDKFIYPEGSDRHMFADVRQGLRKFRKVYTAAFIETLTPEIRDTTRRIT